MTEGSGPSTDGVVFKWHPELSGKSAREVRESLLNDIERDQRLYALAMDGAEQAEGSVLATIVDLERRWAGYDFDWAEMDADILADRILRFELAREERQELFPFSEFRSSGSNMEVSEPVQTAPTQTLPIMKIGAAILILLVIVFLLAVIF